MNKKQSKDYKNGYHKAISDIVGLGMIKDDEIVYFIARELEDFNESVEKFENKK